MSPDPLDIELAIATRREMSLGRNVGLRELVAGEAGLTGKASIGLRAVKCRLGPGKLSIAEFLKFGLDKAPPSELPFFVGHHAQQKMHAACNERSSFDSSKNKLLWADILMKGGFDVPKTLAVYDRKGGNSTVPMLGDEKALHQVTIKPSKNCILLIRFDAFGNNFELHGVAKRDD